MSTGNACPRPAHVSPTVESKPLAALSSCSAQHRASPKIPCAFEEGNLASDQNKGGQVFLPVSILERLEFRGLSSVSCFVLQDMHTDTGPLGWRWGGSLTCRPREWPLHLEQPLPSTDHSEERAPAHLFLNQTFFLQLQQFIPQRVGSGAGSRKQLSRPFSCSVFGGKGGGPTYLGACVALGSHHAKLLKGSLGSGQQLTHAPGISVVLPRVPFTSPRCQEASVHAAPSFWCRWSPLPGLSESVLELPSDVPAGGISWEPWPRPGGSLITRAPRAPAPAFPPGHLCSFWADTCSCTASLWRQPGTRSRPARQGHQESAGVPRWGCHRLGPL